MKLWSDDFKNGETIPAKCAFAKPNAATHFELSDNENPHLAWSDLPQGTRSLALICHDPDVPSRGDDVNQEGRSVPASLPRVDFFHWLLINLPPTLAEIAAGSFSNGVTPRGKPGPEAAHGALQGANDYTGWFAGDPDMGGDYYSYDGPGPPWNDELVHHYHFTVYALDVERCPVEGSFTGPDVLKAIEGHVLGQASIVGTYAIYPNARTKG